MLSEWILAGLRWTNVGSERTADRWWCSDTDCAEIGQIGASTQIGSTPIIASVSVSRWLGSRVVSVHAGLRRWRARVQTAAATLSGNSLRQTVHTHCASVHQAAKLVAALLRVVGVTVGLAKSTAGFMTYVTCRLTAKNRDQLRNPTLGN